MFKGKDCGNPNCGGRRDQSESHPYNGVVQSQAKGGMEMDFPTNTSECNVRQPSTLEPSVGSNEEPMVVSSVQRSRDKGGEEVNVGE